MRESPIPTNMCVLFHGTPTIHGLNIVNIALLSLWTAWQRQFAVSVHWMSWHWWWVGCVYCHEQINSQQITCWYRQLRILKIIIILPIELRKTWLHSACCCAPNWPVECRSPNDWLTTAKCCRRGLSTQGRFTLILDNNAKVWYGGSSSPLHIVV